MLKGQQVIPLLVQPVLVVSELLPRVGGEVIVVDCVGFGLSEVHKGQPMVVSQRLESIQLLIDLLNFQFIIRSSPSFQVFDVYVV